MAAVATSLSNGDSGAISQVISQITRSEKDTKREEKQARRRRRRVDYDELVRMAIDLGRDPHEVPCDPDTDDDDDDDDGSIEEGDDVDAAAAMQKVEEMMKGASGILQGGNPAGALDIQSMFNLLHANHSEAVSPNDT